MQLRVLREHRMEGFLMAAGAAAVTTRTPPGCAAPHQQDFLPERALILCAFEQPHGEEYVGPTPVWRRT
jgi:hypothetical protein